MGAPGHRINEVRKRGATHPALLFVHGFAGSEQDTWGLFPYLIGTEDKLRDWDIFSLGYSTSLLPDVSGIWSADPDLLILATHLRTRLDIPPFADYRTLAIVAHSMGGLVVQQALLENPLIVRRVSRLILFGTPSSGLRKAGLLSWFKPQFRNMAENGEFITALRKGWSTTFADAPPFKFLAVAGDKDQFVPPTSSLGPFAEQFHRVVAGDHLSMVKPKDAGAESHTLLAAALADTPEPAAPAAPLRVGAESGGNREVDRELDRRATELTQAEIVQAALALDLDGNRSRAIELLEKHINLGTDVQGTLAGRIKRRWLQSGDIREATWALDLYQDALRKAEKAQDHEQAYYHAINVAFLKHAAFDDPIEAKALAGVALEHCARADETMWRVATEGEAFLYLGDSRKALDAYRRALAMQPQRWQMMSAGQQAYRIAAKLGDQPLQEELQTLFNPESREINKIFVSYSHKNKDWLERLRTMISPYVRKGELDIWVDTEIEAGARWNDEIRTALRTCKIAVLLVSKEFLASDFIVREELPVILDAVERKEVKILWVYLTPALYEETWIKNYQAAHDPARPLAALPEIEQDEALKKIAIAIRSAVYD